MPRNWKTTSFALGKQRDAGLRCWRGRRVLNKTCLFLQAARCAPVPQRVLETFAQASSPSLGSPRRFLGPLLFPWEGTGPAAPQSPLQHCPGSPGPGRAGCCPHRCSPWGAVLDPCHPSLWYVWLEESQDLSVSVSGKHPRSQQTPSNPRRRISIFMSLITPLKLLCERQQFKKQHHTKPDSEAEAAGEWVIEFLKDSLALCLSCPI